MPGRAADIRPANKKELEATTVVAGAPLPDPDLEAGIELPDQVAFCTGMEKNRCPTQCATRLRATSSP
ncbi:MAG TPA: hypothetical protein QGF63_06205 [Alphaproteobacteria bacterium]|jgi:hypothetical protein|nr:hypothetical protein [Alphaproteobacteria bacterium]